MPYFDNAATSLPKPPGVAEAVREAVGQFGNPSRSAHHAALAAARCAAETRAALADFFGCKDPARVVFTKNATEALNIAIASVEGRLITTEAEHNSVLRPVFHHGNYGIVAANGNGVVAYEDIKAAITPSTVAVVMAHASNLTGNLAPVAQVGRLCRERGLIFILDTAQTAGLLPIDMGTLGVDALCFTGHKSMYGPQGIGGLVLSERFTPSPLMQGGSGSHSFEQDMPPELPDRLEAGTLNGPAIAGLAAALAYIQAQGMASLYRAALHLSNLFLQGAREIPGVTLYGSLSEDTRLPIVTLNLAGRLSAEIADILEQRYSIAVRPGAHCAPLLHKRFGTERQGAVRFSFSHFNTEEEINLALTALREIAEETA